MKDTELLLAKLYEKVLPIMGELNLNKYSKSNFIGYNHKYAPRGKSHHWFSFGVIHEDKPEFWLLIGALKEQDDFLPIRERLIEIQTNNKSFEINDKNGQFLLRVGTPIKNWNQKVLEEALESHINAFNNVFSQLNELGLLGLNQFKTSEPPIEDANQQKMTDEEKKELEKTLQNLHDSISPLLCGLKLNKYSKSDFIGYNYKYAPRGKSHHWLSFGIIHENDPEFWILLGALKEQDDFAAIKEKLIKIQNGDSNFKINEKKGQFFIRAAVKFTKMNNAELEKGLNQILDAAKYALNELNGSGFLGLEKIDEIEPAKSTEENIIKCGACQTELEAGDKFCSNCGEKVELASASAIETSNEEQEVFKNRMDELWEAENWEELVKCFEEKFNWEDLDLKDSDLTIPIQYYLRGLYKIDDREIDALNRSKEVLVKRGCFNEDDFSAMLQSMQLTINATTIFTYAYTAKYLKNIEEIKSAIKLLEKYKPESDYVKELKDKLEELTSPKVPQRYYYKITFTCKTKKEDKTPIKTWKKGTLIKGYFYYLLEEKKLSKSEANNILLSELIYWGEAIDYYFNNKILHPKVNGWEDVTNPVIGKIEVLGKENEFEKPKNGPGSSEW